MRNLIMFLCVIGFELTAYGQNNNKELVIEDVRFVSEGDTLSGTIVLPSGEGLFPAVVEIHGSGKEMRHLWLAKYFANRGIAFLTYDKRGVGKSQGNYCGPETGKNNASPENLILLAKDAAAAFKVLKNWRNIDTTKIGLFGGSQIGWIAPVTASFDKEIRFMVLMSAPVVTVDQEVYYSKFAESNPNFFKEHSKSQIDKLMENSPKTGFDAIPYLKGLNIPVLWLYGEFDNSIPVSESIKNLKMIEKETNNVYEIEILEKRDHQLRLLDQIEGSNDDFVYNYIVEWIKR